MTYREFGNTGKMVSALGMGCMRLPMTGDGDDAKVNDELAAPLLIAAYEAGINYFDTAWFYNNHDSQRAVGKALKGVRDKVFYATKLPSWDVKEPADFDKFLSLALERMDTDYFDFYHFHGLNTERFETLKGLKCLESAEKALADGKIHHLSFSFHGKPEELRFFADTGLFSSFLCQYNLLDRSNEEAMEYAASKGLGIAAMGPLFGGSLGRGGPEFLRRMGSDADSAAELALRFVWGNASVGTAVSGMQTIEEIQQNARYAEKASQVTADEIEGFLRSSEELKKRADIPCPTCRYCKGCPVDIRPASVFELYLNHAIWGLTEDSKHHFDALGQEKQWYGKHPDDCTECGECAPKCPQKIDIPAELKRVSAIMKAL
jgi:hypothetical protein